MTGPKFERLHTVARVVGASAPALLGALTLLAGAGCGNDGSYQVAWRFLPGGDPFRPGDCGAAGVAAIAITATSTDGSQDLPVAPCAPGSFTRTLPAGTWTLVLQATDAEGQLKAPAGDYLRGPPPGEPLVLTVTAGSLALLPPPVVLRRLPECRDGVDNDLDGRVDLDDSDCDGDPNGGYE